MIKRITVKGLFGLYDYDIPFSQNPAVKILTGPNGYGKTTLLLAISHLYKGNFWYFHFLDFEIISVYLQENGFEQSIVIQKLPALVDGNKDAESFDDTDAKIFKEIISLVDASGQEIESVVISENYIQELLTISRRRLYRESITVRDEELLSRYYDPLDDDYIQLHCKNISLALQEYETMYLPAQRLYNREHTSQMGRMPRPYSYEIDHVNDEISRLYRQAQNMFAASSQRIDATYINRLIKREDYYSKYELQQKLSSLKQRIDGYKELNLISNMEILDYSLDEDDFYSEFKKVVSLYVDDMNEKMNRFENLYKKISLYKRVITNKVLSEKTIDFSDNGLKVTNTCDRELPDLHKLSSGEQNLLILYYNLIFGSNSKTILLIDEPENSLHVAWQSKMLDDYISMADTIGCQIVLATHSPTLIDGKWELTTDFYRQYKGKDA